MTSLVTFRANQNVKLESLPERLFLGNIRLNFVDFDNCYALGTQKLPDGLFNGLTKLTVLSLFYTPILNLPNMDALTVRIVLNAVFRIGCVPNMLLLGSLLHNIG